MFPAEVAKTGCTTV